MVSVGLDGLRTSRVDDDGTVHAGQFLESGMRVVPVGAALLNPETVGEGRPGCDTGEADTGHTVHLVRKDDAMPVDGGRLAQPIRHPDGHLFALAPAQGRRRQGPVDRRGDAGLPGEVNWRLRDHQVKSISAQNGRRATAELTRLRERLHRR